MLYDRFGPPEVLHVGARPTPTVRPWEVLVRVHAASLNPKDVLIRKGKMRLFSGRGFPRTPGYDVAGVVEAIGPEVTGLNIGDEVYGMINDWSAGGHAEWVCVPERELAPKPPSLTMVEAAAVPLAALTALQALRNLLELTLGKSVVINGASGGVGTFAVQIAKGLGAEVTAICSAKNEEMVKALGADFVVPYDEQAIETVDRNFDAFFDVFGSAPFPRVQYILGPGGRYVTTIPNVPNIWRDLKTRWSDHPARLVVVESRRDDLDTISAFVRAGRARPIVDRTFTMEESADAHRYLETRRARGKLVLEIIPPTPVDLDADPPTDVSGSSSDDSNPHVG